ncbi:MAG: hypothetical protein Ct9H90mP13_08750 [Pseudomonadota bacterium]|nr:MAG: hypothetical protein Ct9H90mP13_08750 [Pseudomonadota bacterium]
MGSNELRINEIQKLKQLIMPNQMGDIFKCMILGKGISRDNFLRIKSTDAYSLILMDLIQALILAIIQGLTEFLPVSSSAHLILISKIVGWDDQGLLFDIALHFGTLLAGPYILQRELYQMIEDPG